MLWTKGISKPLFCLQVLNSLLNCSSLPQLNLAHLPSRKSWLMPQKKNPKHLRPCSSHRCQKTQLKLALVEIHTRQQCVLKIFKVNDGNKQWIIFTVAPGMQSKSHTDDRQHGGFMLSANYTLNCWSMHIWIKNKEGKKKKKEKWQELNHPHRSETSLKQASPPMRKL